MNNLHIENRHKHVSRKTMRRFQESNIAPTAQPGVGNSSSTGNGVSFRLRQRPTAMDLLNRGLSNLYPGATDQLEWKDEDELIEFEQKMHVLLKNSHVFQQFKDRVGSSESFANPMAARLVLEEFLEQELLFVGKRGVIHRHSELIKHLALTQRSAVDDSSKTSSLSSSQNIKIFPGNPVEGKSVRSSSTTDTEKSDSVTADESSDSSFVEELSSSPSWSPASGRKSVSFSGMKNLSGSLHMPQLEEGDTLQGSSVN